MRSNVDFPHPDGPTMQVNDPVVRRSVMSANARTGFLPTKIFETPVTTKASVYVPSWVGADVMRRSCPRSDEQGVR